MKLEIDFKILCGCCKHEMEEDLTDVDSRTYRVRCTNPECEQPHVVYVIKKGS